VAVPLEAVPRQSYGAGPAWLSEEYGVVDQAQLDLLEECLGSRFEIGRVGYALENAVDSDDKGYRGYNCTFDLNNNGRSEIYVSSHTLEKPNTFVAEYTEEGYQRIAEQLPWFFSTYQNREGATILLGLKLGNFNPFAGTAYEFIWKKDKPLPAAEYSLPSGVSPFGSSNYDINGDGREEYIAFSKGILSIDYKLHVLSNTGKVLWQDAESFGGEPHSFERILVGDNTVTQEPVPLRTYCSDINGDRRADIFLPRNTKKTSGILSAMRTFNKGELVGLYWDGRGLTQNWTSKVIDGYISDFLVADIDGDAEQELILLTVSFPSLIGKARNTIRIYKQTR